MKEERRLVLEMLSRGKITVEEAEQLLDALEGPQEEGSKAGGEAGKGFHDLFEGLFRESPFRAGCWSSPFGRGAFTGQKEEGAR